MDLSSTRNPFLCNYLNKAVSNFFVVVVVVVLVFVFVLGQSMEVTLAKSTHCHCTDTIFMKHSAK